MADLPRREDVHALTVVGLGGSAGSIPALEAFFQGLPGGSGPAYVVVLHLSPDHESRLAELLARSTSLPVSQVTGAVHMEADRVYVIPPGKQLEMYDGSLGLRDLEAASGTRTAIDTFFRTLADAHGPQATAVVLSGTGADGTLGLRRIKEVGGLTVVQSPAEAEYDAMPRNAIATGQVDYVLPAAAMAGQIAAYWQTSSRMRLPAEAAPSPEQRLEGPEPEAALRDILAHVRVQTGHDFGAYKRATVLRRIGRRLQVNGQESLPAYLDFLRRHPAETGDLVGDLLISVTQFFRDPEAWQALERDVLPHLFSDRDPPAPWTPDREPVRVWVCGCATGEEAYTLAILLLEHAARTNSPARLQVFATDMDADAIATAREGVYPDTIAADVSEEWLRRWFYRTEGGRYQVRKEVRETVLFASHDVLRDTPFSRMSLVTCRNLLIYLNTEAQQRVFETFHFALRPEGRLFLGASESAESASSLFGSTDKPHRLFIRRPVARPILPAFAGATNLPALPIPERPRPVLAPLPPESPPVPRPIAGAGELHRSLLELYAPPSALVDERHEVLHLSDGAGRFLRVAGGEPTRDLLQMVRPELRVELRTALFMAASEGQDQVRLARAMPAEGRPAAPVRLTVRPVDAPEGARGYLLVFFQELPVAAAPADFPLPAALTVEESVGVLGPANVPDFSAAPVLRQLEEENAHLQTQVRATVERYEALNEELKASNEELQAINEELRSAAEELETSKEELQSVNEELTTVNHELKSRVDEVSRTNGDLQNFLASTDIGTVFLDRALRIRRYTPAAERLFQLIPTDVGRPLSDLASRLSYPELWKDAARVLERLESGEREVATADGQRHFLARLLPYRTLDDRIDGVVINFVDITERQRAEEALRDFNVRFRAMADTAPVLIWEVDESGAIFVNDHYLKFFGVTFEEIRGLGWTKLLHPDDAEGYIAAYRKALGEHQSYVYECRFLHADGQYHWLRNIGQPVGPSRFVGCSVDITKENRMAANLAFLAEVTQDLVHLTNVDETLDRLGAKIGDHFHASLCTFAEVDEEADAVNVTHGWSRPDVPSILGTRRLSGYISEEMRQAGRAGETIVIRDVNTDGPANAEDAARLGFAALVGVPLFRDGQLRFALTIHDDAPRDWREDEVELLRELAARIWARLERARAEEALRTSEGRLQRMVNVPQVGVLTFDFSGMLIGANDAFLNMVGYDRAGFEARVFSWRDFTPDEHLEASEREFEKMRRIGLAGPYEKEYFRQDGSRVWLMFVAADLGDDTIVEYAIDVSDRKRAQEARAQSEEKYRTLFSLMDEGYAVVELMADENGAWNDFLFLEVNPAFIKQTGIGYPVGRRVTEILGTPNPQWAQIYGRVAETGEPIRFQEQEPVLGRVFDLYAFRLNGEGSRRVAVLFDDITQRRRTEDALRESEERARALIGNLPGGAAFVVNREERYVLAEGEALTTAGFTPDDFLGKTLDEALSPELRAPYRDLYRRAFAGESFEEEHFSHGRWFLTRGVPLRDGDGVTGALAVSYDITTRRQMEEALRTSEGRFRTLADVVPQVIWTNTADGVADYFNRRWYEYTGLTHEESTGPGWQAVVHPDDAPASVERWQQALSAGAVFDTEYRLQRHDGAYCWFLGRNVPLKDEEGRVTGWFGTATDIDDLKQAEVARQESEERFRLLVEGASDYAMFLLDPDRRITFWSAGAERVLGYSEAEALGQFSDLIFTPEDRERGRPEQEAAQARADGQALDRRWHVRRDGERFWADGILMRLDDEEGGLRGFAKVMRDATEQWLAEEEARRAMEAVAQANAELEQRVEERTAQWREAAAARQELTRRLVGAEEEERRRLSRELHDQTGQHLTGLMLGLDALRAIQARGEPALLAERLRQAAAELSREVHQLAWDLRPPALDDIGLSQTLLSYVQEWGQRQGVSADFFAPDWDGDRLAPAVETALYRVVQESLTNVARHARAGRVSVVLERRDGGAVLVVEDDGAGFDVVATLASPTRLGLRGMRERVEMVGGTLEIESTGGGTTLVVNIPAITQGAVTGEATAEAQENSDV